MLVKLVKIVLISFTRNYYHF